MGSLRRAQERRERQGVAEGGGALVTAWLLEVVFAAVRRRRAERRARERETRQARKRDRALSARRKTPEDLVAERARVLEERAQLLAELGTSDGEELLG